MTNGPVKEQEKDPFVSSEVRPEKPKTRLGIIFRKLIVAPNELENEHGGMLQEAIHRLLIYGVGLSTILMLVGLLLDFILKRPVPASLPGPIEAFRLAFALDPAGFLALGLIVLIATPILRVFSSIIAFLYERDWRYAIFTSIVFMIVMISILFGSE